MAGKNNCEPSVNSKVKSGRNTFCIHKERGKRRSVGGQTQHNHYGSLRTSLLSQLIFDKKSVAELKLLLQEFCLMGSVYTSMLLIKFLIHKPDQVSRYLRVKYREGKATKILKEPIFEAPMLPSCLSSHSWVPHSFRILHPRGSLLSPSILSPSIFLWGTWRNFLHLLMVLDTLNERSWIPPFSYAMASVSSVSLKVNAVSNFFLLFFFSFTHLIATSNYIRNISHFLY